MTLALSCEEAQRFLARYHFTPTDIAGVFAHLGTVQYDPLNPAGRNPDLVLQARVPNYCVNDWQKAAYEERLIYDGWDKQACLIRTCDWPMRAHTRNFHRPYHDHEILQAEPETVEKIFAALDAQGPLSSLEFEDRTRSGKANSWSGSTRIKRVMRSMWACGLLLTHHRQAGRHYYDRPERVIPAQYYNQSPPEEDEYYRWILLRRYKAVGLLRPNAEACVWSACGDSTARKRALGQLLEASSLMPVAVGEKRTIYYMPTAALPLLDAPAFDCPLLFLGPLDNILWDRKALQQIFSFNYIWEVYKPAAQRQWGYYVLPVFYQQRFVARVDSRLVGKTWKITQWWWERNIVVTAELQDALHSAITRFLTYLRASDIEVSDQVDSQTAAMLRSILV